MRLIALVAAVLLSANLAARADTLDTQNSGINPNASGYVGQVFIAHGTGTYTGIAFNFYSYLPPTGPYNPTAPIALGAPYALGTGYLFSSQYTGTPSGLATATTALLGTAQASGGVYDFGSAVTLTAGNLYYFYEDALLPQNAIGGQAAAEEFFFAPTAASNYTGYQERSNNYLVTGTSTTSGTGPGTAITPEPSSFLLLGTGVLTLAASIRRRFV